MRKHILALVLFVLLPISLLAKDVTLTWDPMPADQSWEKVVAYEVSGTTYTKRGEVAGSATKLTIPGVPAGSHTYVVRSQVGTLESENSNQASTTVTPSAPTGVKVIVEVTVNVN